MLLPDAQYCLHKCHAASRYAMQLADVPYPLYLPASPKKFLFGEKVVVFSFSQTPEPWCAHALARGAFNLRGPLLTTHTVGSSNQA